MAVTIKDIAKAAKVSTAAVSIALNDRKGIGAQTRQHILQIAKEMNYTPNLAARTLISKHSKTIGLVATNIADPFYPEMALGIEEKANSFGYNIILINTGSSLEREATAIRTLLARGVDGIIFSSVTVDDPNLKQLFENNVPFVTVMRIPANIPEADRVDSVVIDNFSGGYRAIEHLYRIGHDRLAIVAGSMKTSTARERTRGVQHAMKDYGLKFNPRLFYECDYNYKKACEAAKRLLEVKPRPTAVLCYDDNMALGVREIVLTANLRIPEDMALVGFDDIDFASLKGIELTVISQKKYEMGTIATQILINKIESQGLNMVNKVVLEAELVIRRSCGYQLTGYIR